MACFTVTDSWNSSAEPNSVYLCSVQSCRSSMVTWPPHTGRDAFITEPRLTVPLHLSLLEQSLMRNNNPSSSQHYTVWEAGAYHCGQWWRVVEMKILQQSHLSALLAMSATWNLLMSYYSETFWRWLTEFHFFFSEWMAGQTVIGKCPSAFL